MEIVEHAFLRPDKGVRALETDDPLMVGLFHLFPDIDTTFPQISAFVHEVNYMFS